MTDDIDEPDVGAQALDESPALAAGRIDALPLAPDAESFLGPGAKADFFNDGRRDDFFAGKGAPGHGIGRFGLFSLGRLCRRRADAIETDGYGRRG